MEKLYNILTIIVEKINDQNLLYALFIAVLIFMVLLIGKKDYTKKQLFLFSIFVVVALIGLYIFRVIYNDIIEKNQNQKNILSLTKDIISVKNKIKKINYLIGKKDLERVKIKEIESVYEECNKNITYKDKNSLFAAEIIKFENNGNTIYIDIEILNRTNEKIILRETSIIRELIGEKDQYFQYKYHKVNDAQVINAHEELIVPKNFTCRINNRKSSSCKWTGNTFTYNYYFYYPKGKKHHIYFKSFNSSLCEKENSDYKVSMQNLKKLENECNVLLKRKEALELNLENNNTILKVLKIY